MPIETAFTRAFGLEVPLVQGPMGGVAGPALVAAVAEAGALGVLPIWFLPLDAAAELIVETRSRTTRPFAVNVRADLVQTDHISAAVDAGVSLIHLFWGAPEPSMPAVRRGGARMMATVGDGEAARAALDAGACALIAQGVEAGGHVLGSTPLAELLPAVVELAGEVPVVAAGGLSNGDDVAAVLAMGASAALLGSRFAASEESQAHAGYKQALVAAAEGATVRSECFDGDWPDAPHRTLVNSTYRAWHAAGRPAPGERPGEGEIILRQENGEPVERYSAVPPLHGMSGDWEAAALYAGAGVGAIGGVAGARQIIAGIMARL